MAKYASGNQERLRLGFTNNNENDTSLRVVGKVGIGTTVFDASSSLDVRGDASIRDGLTVNSISAGSDDDTLYFYTGGNLSGTISSTNGFTGEGGNLTLGSPTGGSYRAGAYAQLDHAARACN